MGAFKVEVGKDKIATLRFDLPTERVNILKAHVLRELDHLLDRLAKQPHRALIIKSAKPGIFIAGADINEIKDITEPKDAENKAREGQAVLSKLAALPYPTIAVIDGACMGGGTELALACRFRITTDHPKTKIALPEVNLGIIPGFGGTQRLPRIIGLVAALPLILTGKAVDGLKAYKLGLSDACIPAAYLDFHLPGFVREAVEHPSRLLARRKKIGPPRWFQKSFIGKRIILKATHRALIKKTKGHYPAPLLALKVLSKTYGGRLSKGLSIEAKAFGSLAPGEISKNLIRLFFTQEDLKKDSGTTKEVMASPTSQVAVLGAGIMGGGIAWLFSNINIPVRMKDIQLDALKKGFQQAAKIYQKLIQLKKATALEAGLKLNRISGTLAYAGFDSHDLVVEAVVENITLKKKIFQDLEKRVREDTILATNTSSLSITEMAKVLKKPARFVGMHFFNPVNRMPLVEIIPGKKTSAQTLATVVALAKKCAKIPIVVQDVAGFLVNRILLPYMNEAGYVLQEGADMVHVDRLIEAFGMPMGPFNLLDEVGIDIGFHVAEILEKAYGERMQVCDIFKVLFKEKKLLGKKAGKGFYLYSSVRKSANPQVSEVLRQKTYPRYSLLNEEIVNRLILTMVNEAAKCLEEKVVDRPDYLDMAMIMGTGFPPFRGGLLRYADSLGIQTVVDTLNHLSAERGRRFEPAKKLLDLAAAGKTFYSKTEQAGKLKKKRR